jgi:hypothetical protein
MKILWFSVLAVMMASCAGSPPLTDAEKAKLDPVLLRLLQKESVPEGRLDVVRRPDGEEEFGVILRCTDPAILREQGIRVGSVFGEVVTARMTVHEIRKILALPQVRSVEGGSRNVLHQ